MLEQTVQRLARSAATDSRPATTNWRGQRCSGGGLAGQIWTGEEAVWPEAAAAGRRWTARYFFDGCRGCCLAGRWWRPDWRGEQRWGWLDLDGCGGRGSRRTAAWLAGRGGGRSARHRPPVRLAGQIWPVWGCFGQPDDLAIQLASLLLEFLKKMVKFE
uniref:Uncharacterized protein n=1 Tax=Oryza brachyantha TaxID=4533 RepID=J3M3W0_ORYBR